jgi:NDP-sugar pyrophosphorylase family protein
VRELYPGVPKPMIPVAGKPFLDWVLQYWAGQGIGRFLISLGHLAEVAEIYFEGRADVELVREPRPMGTGGAVRLAAQAVDHLGDPFIVANGDSLVAADIGEALRVIAQPAIDGVVLGVRVPDTSRYGSLAFSEEGRLRGFGEKQPGAGAINAGVYFFRRRVLDWFPDEEPLSMETGVFPTLLARGADLRVVTVDAPFLDIGTPESVGEAEAFVRMHF